MFCFRSQDWLRTEITEYLQLPELSFLAAPDGVVQCPSSALRVSVHGLGLLFSSNDRDRCERIIQVSTSRLLFPIFLGYFPLRQTSPQWGLLHNSLLCVTMRIEEGRVEIRPKNRIIRHTDCSRCYALCNAQKKNHGWERDWYYYWLLKVYVRKKEITSRHKMHLTRRIFRRGDWGEVLCGTESEGLQGKWGEDSDQRRK